MKLEAFYLSLGMLGEMYSLPTLNHWTVSVEESEGRYSFFFSIMNQTQGINIFNKQNS